MEIRRTRPSDASTIAWIVRPIFREGSTYTIDPDISEADALAYWLSPKNETFVAKDKGAIKLTWIPKQTRLMTSQRRFSIEILAGSRCQISLQ